MNSDQDYFSKFINGVYYDLGEPEDYSKSRLWAWFLDEANIGRLNNLIGTQISGVCLADGNGIATGYAVSPEMNGDQLAIYKMLFEREYFRSQARQVAKSAATVGYDWTSLGEGDSKLTRTNPNEVAKSLRGLAQDASAELDKAVKFYLKYNAVPDQIAGDDTYYSNSYVYPEYNRVVY